MTSFGADFGLSLREFATVSSLQEPLGLWQDIEFEFVFEFPRLPRSLCSLTMTATLSY